MNVAGTGEWIEAKEGSDTRGGGGGEGGGGGRGIPNPFEYDTFIARHPEGLGRGIAGRGGAGEKITSPVLLVRLLVAGRLQDVGGGGGGEELEEEDAFLRYLLGRVCRENGDCAVTHADLRLLHLWIARCVWHDVVSLSLSRD
jgi:hypothetical protein